VYADTSALAKRFWMEPGSELVLLAMRNASAVASVSLAYVELASATLRASRRGDVAAEDVPGVLAAARREWDDFVRIPVDDGLIQEAVSLVRKYPIRAYDAMHLAAALRWRSLLGELEVLFLAFDQGLLAAASSEGLLVPSTSSLL